MVQTLPIEIYILPRSRTQQQQQAIIVVIGGGTTHGSDIKKKSGGNKKQTERPARDPRKRGVSARFISFLASKHCLHPEQLSATAVTILLDSNTDYLPGTVGTPT